MISRTFDLCVYGGNAAGIAAALAATHDVPIVDVPIEKLQKALADTGVIIHFDDSWVPAAEKQDSYAATADHN